LAKNDNDKNSVKESEYRVSAITLPLLPIFRDTMTRFLAQDMEDNPLSCVSSVELVKMSRVNDFLVTFLVEVDGVNSQGVREYQDKMNQIEGFRSLFFEFASSELVNDRASRHVNITK
jgi:hypothetical protein